MMPATKSTGLLPFATLLSVLAAGVCTAPREVGLKAAYQGNAIHVEMSQ